MQNNQWQTNYIKGKKEHSLYVKFVHKENRQGEVITKSNVLGNIQWKGKMTIKRGIL